MRGHPSQHKTVQSREEGREMKASEFQGKGVAERGHTHLVRSLSSQARMPGSESSEEQHWLGVIMAWGLPTARLADVG